jgi:HlyD family secretion protein
LIDAVWTVYLSSFIRYVSMRIQFLSKPSNRRVLALVIATAVLTAGISYYGISRFSQVSQPPETEAQPIPALQQVVALGQIGPQTEVIKVSVPATLSSDRVAQLLVQRGDRVTAGQVIAILDSRDRLQGVLAEAKEQVSVAQAELAQVQAGAKSGEISAQQAEIARLQAELTGDRQKQQAILARLQSEVNNARAEFERYRSLYDAGAISASQLDQKRLTLETTQAQLNEGQADRNRTVDTLQAQLQSAKANLDRIVEVRPVDVQTVQAKVNQSIAAVQRSEAELAQASVRSPVAGQILEIFAKPGEVVNDNGIVNLGQTHQMQVVAEVDQSNIARIRKGQPAIITGEAFSGELRGTVREIGLEVSRQTTFSNQPGENLDQRIIKVRIRINPEDSKRVAGLTNLQVQVAIQL